MADGLCTEGTVGNIIEKTKVKDYNKVVKCLDTDQVNDLECDNVKSFYISGDSAKIYKDMCGKGSENGYRNVSCEEREEDCRKKRCADRYDSSESSDSGVATLSCTDCSGSSTASSDITEPGSPFSTASSHSEDSQQQQSATQTKAAQVRTAPEMAPNTGAHHPPWPWQDAGGGGGGPTQPKRAKTQQQQLTNCIAQPPIAATVPSLGKHDSNSNVLLLPPTARDRRSNQPVMHIKVQQGKITEYFKMKSQMKPNGIKKDLFSTDSIKKVTEQKVVNSTVPANGKQIKYLALIDRPKGILNGKPKLPSDLYSKLDARTLSTVHGQRNAVKSSQMDKKVKKMQFPNGMSFKILPKPPTLKCVRAKNVTTSIETLFKLNKRAQPNSNIPLQKVSHVTNLNLKVSSTVVPIDKLNNLPSKTNSNINSCNNNNNLSDIKSTVNSTMLSIETGVPTVPVARPRTCAEVLSTPASPKSACSTDSITMRTQHDVSEHKFKAVDDNTGSASSDSGVPSSPLSVIITTEPSGEAEPPPPPQKSPILSQPKTIRFPKPAEEISSRQSSGDSSRRGSDAGGSNDYCRWGGCPTPQFETSGALLEHLQIAHVVTQETRETYVCEWEGCKVQGRTSCSRSWLERHVLSHAGNKPFRCIVQGCGCRFNSQQALERHVNNHFNGDNGQGNSSARKSLDSQGVPKLFKRNGKKLRYRRQPWSARMFDFFDPGIMEGLQHQLVNTEEIRTGGDIQSTAGHTVSLTSRILARRVEPNGDAKLLLRWHPPNISPDEWILEREVKKTKIVSIPTLEPSARGALHDTLYPSRQQQQRQKQRRKNSIPKTQLSTS